MEIIEALIARIRRTGFLFIFGFILIIYIGLGFLYWQQGAQQEELTEQITKLSAVLAKPLSNIEKLRADHEKATIALAPMTDKKAIDTLVGIARKSGINTDNNTFSVPPAKFGQKTVGESSYRVLVFNGISVSGNYSDVMAFIADLDSGETLETMVLTLVRLNKVGGEGLAETQATVDVSIYTNP